MNSTHAPETIVYIGGASVSLWQGYQRVAIRTLGTNTLVHSLAERQARLMSRVRDVVAHHASDMRATESISIVLGSPWVTYHTRTIEHMRTQPFVFSHDLEEALVKEEYAAMRKEMERAHGLFDDVVVGLQVQKHILNGHTLADPFGTAAHRCALPLVVAFAQRTLAHDVLSLFELVLQRHDIHIQSHWQWMAHEYTDQEIVVGTVGAATTDIMWVYDGVVQHTTSIPVGYEAYVAQHNLALDSDEQSHATDTWSRHALEILHQWSAHRVLPMTVELITDDDQALPYLHMLADEIRSLPFFVTPPDVQVPQDEEALSGDTVNMIE